MNERTFNRIYQDTARVCRNLSTKRAGARTDVAIPAVLGNSPGFSYMYGPGNFIGTCVGLTEPKDKLNLEDIDKMDDSPAYAAIPGLGGYREVYRRRLLRNLLKDSPDKSTVSVPISEYLGPVTSMLSTGALGALTGAAISKGVGSNNTADAAIGGGLAGAGIGGAAVVAGALAALIRRKRTLKEQGAYENGSGTLLKNYLLPGSASYNYFKSIGAATRMSKRKPGSEDTKYIDERMKKNKKQKSDK